MSPTYKTRRMSLGFAEHEERSVHTDCKQPAVPRLHGDGGAVLRSRVGGRREPILCVSGAAPTRPDTARDCRCRVQIRPCPARHLDGM